MEGELLNVTEAARLAGVSADTVRRWCDQGRLPSVRTAGGHRRVRREALERLLRDGSAEVLALSPETRDLAAVFENWRDQVERLRPFQERSFDRPAELEHALLTLEGVRAGGSGGLLGALAGLARELHEIVDEGRFEADRASVVSRGPWGDGIRERHAR